MMKHTNRRNLLKSLGLGLVGYSASGWLPVLAAKLASNPQRRRQCVLLWMNGGPSQTDTFDMKPGHKNGGEFSEIDTAVAGIRMSEHLPGLAARADKLAIVRGLSTKEGDHGRGTFLMRTGYQPRGELRYPTIGASLSKELGDGSDGMPSFVSISPYLNFNQAAYSPGFLGPRYAPLTVGATDAAPSGDRPNDDAYARLTVDNLVSGSESASLDDRLRLWRTLQDDFLERKRSVSSVVAHDTVYRRAVNLMHSESAHAFDLTQEPDPIREAYGRGRFGQGCLMARRLLERGVSFVEVSLGRAGSVGWDTHTGNFPTVQRLSEELDAGWTMLMSDLSDRGLLDSTTILWMGEFGRTPQINGRAGRDHFPAAWTCVFAGGGIAGGQVYGQTSDDGMQVVDGKATAPDVIATLCEALGVPAETQNESGSGRPIRITEGTAINDLLA
jgi:hypothetical protein